MDRTAIVLVLRGVQQIGRHAQAVLRLLLPRLLMPKLAVGRKSNIDPLLEPDFASSANERKVLRTNLPAEYHLMQAEDLKGFYVDSGGISSQHRVVMIDFAADGTALIQQKWRDKHLRTWHARWKKIARPSYSGTMNCSVLLGIMCIW
jgi:hypothetical protein